MQGRIVDPPLPVWSRRSMIKESAIMGIDHTLIGVRDLEAARTAWARLGLQITPRGRHIGWGTANYCIMLERGYIELLGIVDDKQLTNNLDKFLEQREGLLGLAFNSRDGDATAAWLRKQGLHPRARATSSGRWKCPTAISCRRSSLCICRRTKRLDCAPSSASSS